jgi:Cu(I)/Ag(I) efflux system membrane fusion protein
MQMQAMEDGQHDMNMDMSSDGAVMLTPDQIRQFGITFGVTAQRTLHTVVHTVGIVAVDETRLVQVTPKFGGYAESLYVDETGQRVHRGQPLLSVYAPELVAAEQELLVATTLQKNVGPGLVPGVPERSVDLVGAARRKLQLWDISNQQIAEILQSGQIQRTLALYAPASGIVLDKHIVQGQAFRAGQTLYTIANLSDVWIDVALREQDAGLVQTGSEASIQLTAYPGRTFTGRVSYVYPTLDTTARTVRARIQVRNHDNLLKPGMYAAVTLVTPMQSALTIPNSAIVQTGKRVIVFVDAGRGHVVPRTVTIGYSGNQYTEILHGLTSGQRVVTSAQFLLDAESNLAEVMKSMIGQMGMSDMENMDNSGNMSGMKR